AVVGEGAGGPGGPAYGGGSLRTPAGSVAAQDREDAQDLDVHADQGDREAEGDAPGVLARDPGVGGVLDVLEVHHQGVGGHHDGDAADDQPQPALTHVLAQQQHRADVDQHEDAVGDHRDEEDLVQARRGAQHPEAEQHQHGAGDGEGAAHGLQHDA